MWDLKDQCELGTPSDDGLGHRWSMWSNIRIVYLSQNFCSI